MFNEKQLNAYRSIKADDALLQQIKAKAKAKRKRTAYFITAAAACLVLIMSGFFVNNHNNIIVNGQKLTDSVVFYDTASAYARTVSSTVSVPIEIKASKKTDISVSGGTISINGSAAQKQAVISSNTLIWWEVDPNTESEFEMIISSKKDVKKVTLKYDNGKITVSKENLK